MTLHQIKIAGLLIGTLALADIAVAQDPGAAMSTSRPTISLEELDIELLPLTSDQLEIEAEGWRSLLSETVTQIGDLEIQILLEQREIQLRPTAADDDVKDDQTAKNPEMDPNEAQASLSKLRDQRGEIIERLRLVLIHITEKSGLTSDNEEPEIVLSLRRYIDSVDGIRTSVVDSSTFWSEVFDWVMSPEGGQMVLKRIATLIAITIAFFLGGIFLAKGITKGLDMTGKSSRMLKTFISRNLPRAALVLGLLFGLSVLGINITPVLALIGGASFVVAFALQDSLSNFASGIMIMFYRPFDIGDYVKVASAEGTVKSMTLVSTTVTTVDNKILILPNNSIWGDVITNVTGSHERRVDLVFGIGYEDDMAKAEALLWEAVNAHEKVLKEPTPLIKVHELADSSVNFICRPWVKTADYWDVYWDLTRQVKERFDQEGVSIPFPQRDVHLFPAAPESS